MEIFHHNKHPMEVGQTHIAPGVVSLHHSYAAAAMTALITLDRTMDRKALAAEAHDFATQMMAYSATLFGPEPEGLS